MKQIYFTFFRITHPDHARIIRILRQFYYVNIIYIFPSSGWNTNAFAFLSHELLNTFFIIEVLKMKTLSITDKKLQSSSLALIIITLVLLLVRNTHTYGG